MGRDDKSDHDLITETHLMVGLLCKKVDKVNGRVSSLERWRWLLTGAVIILGALYGPDIVKLFR